MQRGVFTLKREELLALLTVLDINKFKGFPFFNKLNSAKDSIDNEISISISEDEIEKILDEVGPAIYGNQLINDLITKLNEFLLKLRI